MKDRFSTLLLSSVAVAMTLPLAGCGSGGSTLSDATLTASSPSALSRSMTTFGGLRLTLSEDKFNMRVGQSVTYTLTITNVTDKPITYLSEIGCESQIIPSINSIINVYQADGTLYSQVGGGGACGTSGAPQPTSLAAGTSLTSTIAWQFASNTPGIYATRAVVYGVTSTDPAQFSTPLTFGDLKIVVTQ